jgi:hypothetical protein
VKKFASIVASAALMSGGLLAAAPAATAAPTDCGDYPTCIDTRTRASALNNPRVGNPAKVAAKVVANSNRTPRGTLVFTYKRDGDVVDTFSRDYDGGREEYSFFGLPKGQYKVVAQFRGDGRFNNSRDTFNQRVRPRR